MWKRVFLILAWLGILIPSLMACATKQPGLYDDAILSSYQQVKRGDFPFQGEILRFTARHVNTRVELADVDLYVGYKELTESGQEVIRITTEGKSKPLVSLVAKIDDRAIVFIDANTWESIYSHKHLDENGRERDFHVWFWPQEMRASVERIYKGEKITREAAIPAGSMDTMAWVYYMRSLPLEVGKRYSFFTFDGWTINKITLHIAETEELWSPLGFFPCYKIDIYRERNDGRNPLGALSGVFVDPELVVEVEEYLMATAWLAQDELKTPIRLAISTALGEFDMMIREISKAER